MAQSLVKVSANFQTQLAAASAVGATSLVFSSVTDADSIALPSGTYGFTVDEGTSSEEHFIGTVTSGVTTVASVSHVTRTTAAATSGLNIAHRLGAIVKITDHPAIRRMLNVLDGTTNLDSAAPLGYDAAPASLSGNQLATVAYVLGVVAGGTVTFDQQVLSNQVSGETLAVNDVVYFKESDQRWWKADADLTATFDQLRLGINRTVTGGAGATIQVSISGPVTGFSGLTAGSKYYVSNTAGGISTSAGTYSVFIGWALTTTIFLIDRISKTLPTQKEKDAMAGSTGTPSTTNKFITQDNTSASGADQSQTTQNAVIEVGEANATTKKNTLWQSFTPDRTKIRGVKLYKSANTGTFANTVAVSLRANNAGSPDNSDLVAGTLTSAQYNALPVGEFEVIFSAEYTVTPGTLYWIGITCGSADNSNHPNLGTNTLGGYSSGSVKYFNATDGFVAVATIDLYFKTIEGAASQIVKTNTSGKIPENFYDTAVLGTYQAVGALGNALVKTYFNIQLFFNLWTGAVSGDATTTFVNWVRNSTDVFVSPNGSMIDLINTGADSMILSSFWRTGAATALQFNATNIIVMDWWAKLPSSATGDINMGFGSTNNSPFVDTYNATDADRVMFTQNAGGTLYATSCRVGAVTNTSVSSGITLTNWNNYRIELDLSNNALFYINGVLKATISGATIPNAAADVCIGFGRSNTALFQVTAPNVSVEMNP